MALAGMIAIDRNALICDLAETYQIYDYRRVPGRLLGILATGLRDDSRIKQKINGVKTNDTNMILANILDGINLLLWTKTKDAEKGINQPDSIAETLFVKEREEVMFETPEDFEKERQRLITEIENV